MSEEEIKEIAREEMLDTIKNKLDSSMIFTYVDNLEKENKQLKSILTELEEWLKEQWYEIEPKGTGINFNCEYDSEEDYVNAMKEQSKLNTLKIIKDKIQKLKEKYK